MQLRINGVFERNAPRTTRAPSPVASLDVNIGEQTRIVMDVLDEFGDPVRLAGLSDPAPTFALNTASRLQSCGGPASVLAPVVGTIDTETPAANRVVFELDAATWEGVPAGSYVYNVTMTLLGVVYVLVSTSQLTARWTLGL